ncbi:hypothetical protein A343_0692 [Porphyromonas gingivalis JCVI SC001]|nr:hypothetical protein A343_0692 [Porphyromonas gingivalis JCVI SC001]
MIEPIFLKVSKKNRKRDRISQSLKNWRCDLSFFRTVR